MFERLGKSRLSRRGLLAAGGAVEMAVSVMASMPENQDQR